jgi:hypothetical protein
MGSRGKDERVLNLDLHVRAWSASRLYRSNPMEEPPGLAA